MRVIIAGSRNITDYDRVKPLIDEATKDLVIDEIVSGGAQGADLLGERWAKEHNITVKRFPAEWKVHGKSAGPIRNQAMAVYAASGPNHGALIALWDGISRGTKSMIDEATLCGLEVTVVYPYVTFGT